MVRIETGDNFLKRKAFFASIVAIVCAVGGVYSYSRFAIAHDISQFDRYKTTNEAQAELAKNPRDAKAIRTLAVDAVIHGRSDEAITLYREDIAIEPDNRHSKYELANLLRLHGKADEAFAILRSLTDKDDVVGQSSKKIIARYGTPSASAAQTNK